MTCAVYNSYTSIAGDRLDSTWSVAVLLVHYIVMVFHVTSINMALLYKIIEKNLQVWESDI